MATNKKTVRVYNTFAKEWEIAKKQGKETNHIYLEKPAIYKKLTELKDKIILCLGCGLGTEVEHLYSLGAKKVIGIDIAKNLIEIAKKTYPEYEFYTMDMEKLEFPEESFDIVFSSMAIHYLKSWRKVFHLVHKVLKKNGIFLFSTNHPFISAMKTYENENTKTRILGYSYKKDIDDYEIFGDYFKTSRSELVLNRKLSVTRWHRPLSLVINDILAAGFEIKDITEPQPVNAAQKKNVSFWKLHQKIPEFIIYELRKK